MLFNTLPFAIFLLFVVAIFWASRPRHRPLVLLAASYVFYGWWDARFLSLILISTLTDFAIGKRLEAEGRVDRRRALLAISVGVNIGMLGLFKYWNFFIESTASLLSDAGLNPNLPFLEVVLPVGISFYTFQTLSYTIDVYRRDLPAETDLGRFALFVAFFPQLVAGPIERANRLLPQLHSIPTTRPTQIKWRQAGMLIGRGLLRKIVIADGVAVYVNAVFGAPSEYAGLAVATAVVAFSIQIYGDFAGYTDIARGVALLFGVQLQRNFESPYSSTSFRDFWRRWHISLSTWLRDYLYIPLGGNRRGRRRTSINIMLTMLLGGLWHGAGWGFVLWGALHGLYLSVERAASAFRGRHVALPSSVIFAVVTLTWIPFRAGSWSATTAVFSGLFAGFHGRQMVAAPIIVGIVGAISMLLDRSDQRGSIDPLAPVPPFAKGFSYGAVAALVLVLASRNPLPFIYFQF